jgi:hypothetical protein
MKSLLACCIVLAAVPAHAMPMADQVSGSAPAQVLLTGNTSSNSSSNTSSNQSAGGSSVVHTHTWSIDSDRGSRRRSVRGSTRIERYAPSNQGYYRHRRDRGYRFDDD